MSDKKVKCLDCGGDGRETCNNPDHGFIDGVGGEIGRLGCPGCGYDVKRKIPGGGDCLPCRGTGKMTVREAEIYCDENQLAFNEDDLEYIN